LHSVLDPFCKEFSRIQRSMEQNSSTAHQVKIYSRYTVWIEKAIWWADTCSQMNSLESAKSIFLDHALRDFHACIDRDTQLIHDYLVQSIQGQKLTNSLHSELERRLDRELGLHLAALQQLKALPPEESLEGFSGWKTEVDRLRERCFSDALHTIDLISD